MILQKKVLCMLPFFFLPTVGLIRILLFSLYGEIPTVELKIFYSILFVYVISLTVNTVIKTYGIIPNQDKLRLGFLSCIAI